MNDKRDWPDDLPVFGTDLDAEQAKPRDDVDLAEELARLALAAGLGEHLDDALAGKSSPRVWLLLHEPGQTHLAALAALEFAEALAKRDLAAFVLDGDDRTSTLSRWFGREATEGWIDLVRYGASVLTAGTALPSEGRTAYLFGVGSYAPTDVSPEETAELVARLRRQADDILVVAPVDTAGLWGNLADIRLLCLDRAQRSGGEVAELRARLGEVGAAPDGLVTWGRAAALVDDVLRESEPADESPAALETPEPAGEEKPKTTTGSESRRGRGSSGVFWFAAAVAVIIIGTVAAYYLRYVRGDDRDLATPPESVAAMTRPAPEEAVAVMDTAAAMPATEDPVIPSQPETTAAEQDAPPVEVAEPEPEPEPETSEPVFDYAPYTGVVGEAGWALHLFSFPDPKVADSEVARLGRRGLEAAIRTVEIPDKGRYHRVYVGSFPSKAVALAAVPALQEKLGVDWARPTEFEATQE